MIGIVGGMGPHAAVDFCSQIIGNTKANFDQEHLDVLLSNRPSSIPDRIDFIFGKSDINPAIAINEQIQSLHTAGASSIGIPCVTAHTPKIFDRVREFAAQLGVRLFSIVEETLNFVELNYPEIDKIGSISTSASYKNKLFEDPITNSRYEFIDMGFENNDALVVSSISNREWGIKSISQPVSAQVRSNLTESIDILKKMGAQAVILGCTELPLAIPEKELNGVFIINPMQALARGLIASIDSTKLKDI